MGLVPENIWPCLKTLLFFKNGDGDRGVDLVNTAPEMFLNIVMQRTAPTPTPTTENYLTQNITIVKP